MTWNVADYCPELLPNETVHSWVIRWVIAIPFPYIKESITLLIGSSNKQLDTIFPGYLPQLSASSGESINHLIENHTIIPYFKSFCDNLTYQSLLDDVLSGHPHNAYSKLSLIAGRVTKASNLYSCPICIENDIHQYGVSYFHVFHQLPGVQVCVHHRVRLFKSKSNRRSLVRPPITSNKAIKEAPTDTMLKLALVSSELLKTNRNLRGRVNEHYFKRLKDLKFGKGNQSVQQTLFRKALEYYHHDNLKNELVEKIFSLGKTTPYPSQLFYNTNCHFHPLKHLLLITFLFESLQELLTIIDTEQNLNLKAKKASPSTPLPANTDYFANIIDSLQQGFSLRKVSRMTGLSVNKVKQIAVSHSISINRRESLIFNAERETIKKALERGEKTSDIASKIPCSTGAVEQILAQHPQVKKQREEYIFNRKREHARSQIILTMGTLDKALLSRYNIKKKASACYTWLYKFDNEWLYKTLPPRK